MSSSPTYNILMYSHDTYGLGHIRRSMAIANHLRDKQTNVLILTGSPLAGRFHFPDHVDFVRIPGMVKKTNDEYQSLSIRIHPEHALSIRTNIILATAQAFQPDLLIVDKEPHGLKNEVLPTLEWLRRSSPQTRSILGLRDILDSPEVICRDWLERGVYSTLIDLYDEVWVYGNRYIYDPIEKYLIPPVVQEKVTFTGYIPRKKLSQDIKSQIRRQYRIDDDDIFILVTAGGGGDGWQLLDHFLAMHEHTPASLTFKSTIVTGPFMPKQQQQNITKRAKLLGIKTLPFHPRLEEMMKSADLVVSMGGYNTICEILTQQTPALVIPRESPRQEQLIRAMCLKDCGLIDYIPWTSVTPGRLLDKILSIIHESNSYINAMKNFPLSGLDTMLSQLNKYRKVEESVELSPEVILTCGKRQNKQKIATSSSR